MGYGGEGARGPNRAVSGNIEREEQYDAVVPFELDNGALVRQRACVHASICAKLRRPNDSKACFPPLSHRIIRKVMVLDAMHFKNFVNLPLISGQRVASGFL